MIQDDLFVHFPLHSVSDRWVQNIILVVFVLFFFDFQQFLQDRRHKMINMYREVQGRYVLFCTSNCNNCSPEYSFFFFLTAVFSVESSVHASVSPDVSYSVLSERVSSESAPSGVGLVLSPQMSCPSRLERVNISTGITDTFVSSSSSGFLWRRLWRNLTGTCILITCSITNDLKKMRTTWTFYLIHPTWDPVLLWTTLTDLGVCQSWLSFFRGRTPINHWYFRVKRPRQIHCRWI